MRYSFNLCVVALLAVVAMAQGQPRSVGMLYWNVEQLYDTIDSPFDNERGFRRGGANGWSGERYVRKVEQIARTVDSLAAPIVVLYGVENEGVVRDIVVACKGDYTYIHKTLNNYTGLDFALLYYGDLLFIDEWYGYGFGARLVGSLYVEESDYPIVLDLVDNRFQIDRYWRDHYYGVETENRIMMGRVDEKLISKLGLYDPLAQLQEQGVGNLHSQQRGWYFGDRFAISHNLEGCVKCGVVAAPWLMDLERGVPLETYDRLQYVGGASKYLPLYMEINITPTLP